MTITRGCTLGTSLGGWLTSFRFIPPKGVPKAQALVVRSGNIPIYKNIELEGLFDEKMFQMAGNGGISIVSMLDIGRFLTSPGLWAGIIVCGLLTTAAIYVRRYRGES